MNIWVEPVEWDAEKEGKGNSVAELKEVEDETKVAEQGKDGEQDGDRVKTEEPPIIQIDVEVQNFVTGQPVWGSKAIGVTPDDNCASSHLSSSFVIMRVNVSVLQGFSIGPFRIAR